MSSMLYIIYLVSLCAYHLFTWAIVDYLRRCSSNLPETTRPSYKEGLLIMVGLSTDLLIASLATIHWMSFISLIGGEVKSLSISNNAQRLTNISA